MYGKIAKIKDVIGCTHGLRGKALQHSFHETWCRVLRCCAATISFSLPESESEMKQLLFCRNESGALCNYFFLLFIFTPNQFLFFFTSTFHNPSSALCNHFFPLFTFTFHTKQWFLSCTLPFSTNNNFLVQFNFPR